MIMSESINEIALALSKAQSMIEPVQKSKKGHGYMYAELVDCLEMIKDPLAKNELSLTQIGSMDGIMDDKQPVLVTMLMHSSGEWIRSIFALTPEGTARMNNMQALGSCITYLRRYAICAMLGIAQEDDDGVKAIAPKETPKKEEPKKVVHPSVLALKELCEKNNIDLKDFTQTFNIVSSDIKKVEESVKNFQDLLDVYNDKKNNIIEDVLE